MLVCVVNDSTMVQNADVDLMCQACNEQLVRDVMPAWNLKNGNVMFCADKTSVPANAWVIHIIDDNTQVEGALGFHQEEQTDKVDGFIMCKPILTNGGAVLAFDGNNPGQYTVSATLSHEIIEAVGDPDTNSYYDDGATSWAGELCDPVEQIGYGIVVNGRNVSVSDFVFPAFFNPFGKEAIDGKFNFLGTLTAPFTILPGGYAIKRSGGPGSEQQVFGEAMPEWRKATKQTSFARASRRIGK